MNNNLWLLDADQILEEVDEYLLYCHYLGFHPELRVKYQSPIRDKDNPDRHGSFSVFDATRIRNREFGWKDNGTGQGGDIYELVRCVFRYRSRIEAVAQVRHDFIISGEKSELPTPVPIIPPPVKITIKSQSFDQHDLAWWSQFNVAGQQLKKFNCTRVQCYWMTKTQVSPSFPGPMSYAYRIYDHYQLYFPTREPDRKFRNDLDERHLPGFCQLKRESPLLIITKAFKDIMTLDGFGYEAVAPKGEHSFIQEKFLNHLKECYRNIVILYDNDGKHNGYKYDLPVIEIPRDSGTKDISDYCKRYGPDSARLLLARLLQPARAI